MRIIKTIRDTETTDLVELFLYRKIIKATEDTLTLDNGYVLEIIPNEGCGGCSNGWFEISELNTCENVITSVIVDEKIDGRDYETLSIFVFAEDRRITALQVSGTEGNGYYGRGYRIQVKAVD